MFFFSDFSERYHSCILTENMLITFIIDYKCPPCSFLVSSEVESVVVWIVSMSLLDQFIPQLLVLIWVEISMKWVVTYRHTVAFCTGWISHDSAVFMENVKGSSILLSHYLNCLSLILSESFKWASFSG